MYFGDGWDWPLLHWSIFLFKYLSSILFAQLFSFKEYIAWDSGLAVVSTACVHMLILMFAWWGGASEAADMIHGISTTPLTGSDLMRVIEPPWSVSSMVMIRTCILATTVYRHNQVLGNGHWYFTSNQATWQHSRAPEEWWELLLFMIKVWDILQQSWVSLKCTKTWMFCETMSAPHSNVSKIFFLTEDFLYWLEKTMIAFVLIWGKSIQMSHWIKCLTIQFLKWTYTYHQ